MSRNQVSSRRTFLKTASAQLLPDLLVWQLQKNFKNDEIKWDREADVVVLGYGNAGSECRNCCCRCRFFRHHSGKNAGRWRKRVCFFRRLRSADEQKTTITLSKALYELSRSVGIRKSLRVFCEESLKLGDYVKSLDPQVILAIYGHAGYQNLPGADCVNKISPRNVPGKKGGERLFGIFQRAVEKRNILSFLTRRLNNIRCGNEVAGVVAFGERQTD